MTTEVDKKLWKYLFPVTETKVQVKDTGGLYFPTDKYKAIIREDNNELIAIQKKSYKLVPIVFFPETRVLIKLTILKMLMILLLMAVA